jgi:hypothetical protein
MPDDFVLVDVPDLQFVMIDGEGDPGGEPFTRAARWLFAVTVLRQPRQGRGVKVSIRVGLIGK